MVMAARPTIMSGGANSQTKRVTITTGGNSVTLPSKIQSVIFKNAGANDIRLRINATGSNYWTLKPNEQTPKILVQGATIDASAVSSDSTLECIFEG